MRKLGACPHRGKENDVKMRPVSTSEKEKELKNPAVSTAGKRNKEKTFFVSTFLDWYK